MKNQRSSHILMLNLGPTRYRLIYNISSKVFFRFVDLPEFIWKLMEGYWTYTSGIYLDISIRLIKVTKVGWICEWMQHRPNLSTSAAAKNLANISYEFYEIIDILKWHVPSAT